MVPGAFYDAIANSGIGEILTCMRAVALHAEAVALDRLRVLPLPDQLHRLGLMISVALQAHKCQI